MTDRREQMVQKVTEAIEGLYDSEVDGFFGDEEIRAGKIAKIAVDTILAQPTYSTVDIVKEKDKPTTCEVRVGDVVLFRGRSYEADLEKRTVPIPDLPDFRSDFC